MGSGLTTLLIPIMLENLGYGTFLLFGTFNISMSVPPFYRLLLMVFYLSRYPCSILSLSGGLRSVTGRSQLVVHFVLASRQVKRKGIQEKAC